MRSSGSSHSTLELEITRPCCLITPNRHAQSDDSLKFDPITVNTPPPLIPPTDGLKLTTSTRALYRYWASPVTRSSPSSTIDTTEAPSVRDGAMHSTSEELTSVAATLPCAPSKSHSAVESMGSPKPAREITVPPFIGPADGYAFIKTAGTASTYRKKASSPHILCPSTCRPTRRSSATKCFAVRQRTLLLSTTVALASADPKMHLTSESTSTFHVWTSTSFPPDNLLELGLTATTTGTFLTSNSALVDENFAPSRLTSTEWLPVRSLGTVTVNLEELIHSANSTCIAPNRQEISFVSIKSLPCTVTFVLPYWTTELGTTRNTWISAAYANHTLVLL